MKTKNYVLIIISCLLFSGFISSSDNNKLRNYVSIEEINNKQLSPDSAILNKNPAKVAIYNEANLTSTNYDTSIADYNNNVTQLQSVLEAEGFEVTLLTTNDIFNHQLLTAKYDVFIIADNAPRENITNFVTEYWLGGGSILGLDSAVVYLCYFGLLPIESAGDDGYGDYWKYLTHNITIKNRHPITKSYDFDDKIVVSSDLYSYLAWNWTKLQTTSIASELTYIAQADEYSEFASVIALDPTTRGGKIVSIGYDYAHESVPAINNMIIDSLNWLVPHPKGRILFDLSHIPYEGIDSWDSLSKVSGQYSEYRNNLVSCGYAFDKLYPSASGNLTTENLADYDILIENIPEYNFTSSERAAITDWVSSGGGLFVLGDLPSYNGGNNNYNLNYLLSNFDLSLFMGYDGVDSSANEKVEHPTTEDCSSISMPGNRGYINFTGDAYPIWGNNAGDYYFGGQEYGTGRIILAGDIGFIANSVLGSADNKQYAINVANWLTSDNARVLVYVDDLFLNRYQTPAILALNELEMSFHLTFDKTYFNLSLHKQTWDFVIVDNVNDDINTIYGDILNYVKSGGKLIFCSWYFGTSNGNELWDYLGFKYGEKTLTTPPEIYLWDPSNNIFNYPINYNALSIATVEGGYTVDYSSLIPHDNGTAIAGISPFVKGNNSAIILSPNGNAITNSMLISNYRQDTDDSTYSDALEIWINEIAYLALPPQAPTIITENQTISTNQTSIVWSEVQNADSYKIYIENNGTTEIAATGFEQIVQFPENGTYTIFMTALNENGESIHSNEITIVVEILEEGNTAEDGNGLLDSLSDPNTITWMAITGGGILLFTLIIPGIFKIAKKKKGKK